MNDKAIHWERFLDILKERNKHASFPVSGVKSALKIDTKTCDDILSRACEEQIIEKINDTEFKLMGC